MRASSGVRPASAGCCGPWVRRAGGRGLVRDGSRALGGRGRRRRAVVRDGPRSVVGSQSAASSGTGSSSASRSSGSVCEGLVVLVEGSSSSGGGGQSGSSYGRPGRAAAAGGRPRGRRASPGGPGPSRRRRGGGRGPCRRGAAARPGRRPRVQGRVLRVLGRLVGPGLDLAVAGRAVVVQGLEEVGRTAGLLLGRAPPVAGAEQQGAGAGEGDVAEAEFLGVLVVLHGLVEGLQALGVPGLDVGQGVGVAAQGVRQDLGLGGPLLAALVAREGAGDQAGDGDDVPLQALGLVRGEHLDGVLAAGQGVVEALLVLGGGAQEAEEGQQGGLAVAGGERGARCPGSWPGSRGGGRPGRAGTRTVRPPGR